MDVLFSGLIIMNLLVDSCVFINAFKNDSEYRDDSRKFLDFVLKSGQIITMPAHGWFEVWCNLKRIERIDKQFSSTTFDGFRHYPIRLIHIDAHFISKYGNVDIPYARAGDHIYLVVAHVDLYQLITWDKPMVKIARELNIDVENPTDYLALASRK